MSTSYHGNIIINNNTPDVVSAVKTTLGDSPPPPSKRVYAMYVFLLIMTGRVVVQSPRHKSGTDSGLSTQREYLTHDPHDKHAFDKWWVSMSLYDQV